MKPTERRSEAQGDTRLRRGWTTGACAAAAAAAAYRGLRGEFPDAVELPLANGQRPVFAVALARREGADAIAGIVKDAGDDPDVTHQAMIVARLRHGEKGTGITFHAGEGVGTITRPGLPLAAGEPAINPAPRRMIAAALQREAAAHGKEARPDIRVEIAVPGGAALAAKTWNPRLGIEGGLSILGTTGVVIPYSCSAWIHSIHRGVDVARAAGLEHIGAATGKLSEAALRRLCRLPETARIDLGDFIGGFLKYLRRHPIKRVSIAGGAGKLSKFAGGALDLHSGRSQVDFALLASLCRQAGGDAETARKVAAAGSAGEALAISEGIPIADAIAKAAQRQALSLLDAPRSHGDMEVEILIIDRQGALIGRADFASARK